MNLELHLERQRAWSRNTFGPGHRTGGVIDHIRKELTEIEAEPLDLTEWVDVVILALDGAWRTGATSTQIAEAITAKQARNESRVWPDWQTMSEDVAIEHDRTKPTTLGIEWDFSEVTDAELADYQAHHLADYERFSNDLTWKMRECEALAARAQLAAENRHHIEVEIAKRKESTDGA